MGSLPWYLAAALAVASLCAGGWGAYQGQRLNAANATIDTRNAELARASDQIAKAKETNDANVAELARYKAIAAAVGTLTQRFETDAAKRRLELQRIQGEIADAPANDDGPIAPVLVRQLDRMRTQTGSADGGNANPGGSAARPPAR